MNRIKLGLWVLVWLSACETVDRPVQARDGSSGAIDLQRWYEPGRLLEGPAKGVGDPTTCVFLDGRAGTCSVATNYPGPLAFECEGEGSCSVTVTAPFGTELTWKSSCGGYAYSVIDGRPDTIGFACDGEMATDVVTCAFTDSSTKQTCSSSGLPGPFFCSGVGKCEVWVMTKQGTKLDWSSSCGGTATTVVDGVNKLLPFSCK